MTYVGELGWELYCPTEFGLRLWDVIWEAGRSHGLVAGGYRAIDSLRLEKGYRVWGSDVTPDDTPFEAGRRVRRQARQGRLHRARALLERREPAGAGWPASCSTTRARSPSARSRCAWTAARRARHERRLRLHGRALDRVRLPPGERGARQRVEVEIFGAWVAGSVAEEPLYDPNGDRIRA